MTTPHLHENACIVCVTHICKKIEQQILCMLIAFDTLISIQNVNIILIVEE